MSHRNENHEIIRPNIIEGLIYQMEEFKFDAVLGLLKLFCLTVPNSKEEHKYMCLRVLEGYLKLHATS